LTDVSDPGLVFDLYEKLRATGIFLWHEVEQLCEAFTARRNRMRRSAIFACPQ
jgi:type I restriction enzyme R subunit